MSADGRLAGKVALITGAARGQGAAEARTFAAEGAEVVVADLLDDLGAALADELGPRGEFVHLDVTDEDSWADAIARTEQRFGRLDVLVNNAGVLRFGKVQHTSAEDLRLVLDVNLVGTFLGIRAAAPVLRRSGGGSIVNISSTAGLVGLPSVAAYSASKWAVTGLTKSAAIDLGPWGVRVNSVHPGSIDTPMIRFDGLGDDAYDPYTRKLPIRGLGTPDDVVGLVLFLASDESAYCTGGSYPVDGGQTAGDHGFLG